MLDRKFLAKQSNENRNQHETNEEPHTHKKKIKEDRDKQRSYNALKSFSQINNNNNNIFFPQPTKLMNNDCFES